MNLASILATVSEQLRISPLFTDTLLTQWLTQAIKTVNIRSRFLEKFAIIPCKASVQRYFLPADHLATIGALYDGQALERINASEIEFVSPVTPIYYYEDEWEDEASETVVGEFATHYTLNELWPLQLMRSQQSAGSKTITLLAAPTVDGVAASSPIVGILDGEIVTGPYFESGYFEAGYFWEEADGLVWLTSLGAVVAVVSTELNLLVFYKHLDTLPANIEDDVVYNDLLASMYISETLGLALSTEDDEYDRYRSWLYEHIANTFASVLAGIAVNKGIA